MAKVLWAAFCTKTSTDKVSNNISLFEVLEQLGVSGIDPEKKVVIPTERELAIMISRSDPEKPEVVMVQFSFVSPKKEVLAGGEFQVNMTEHKRSRLVVRINGLPIVGPGIYEFLIELKQEGEEDWTEATRVPLEVNFME